MSEIDDLVKRAVEKEKASLNTSNNIMANVTWLTLRFSFQNIHATFPCLPSMSLLKMVEWGVK